MSCGISEQPAKRSLIFRALGIAVVMVAMSNSATGHDRELPDRQLDSAGLKVQWFTHTGVGMRGSLVDWCLNVNENNATTYFTIHGGDYSETLSQHTLGPTGQPLGIEEGLQYAQIRMEIVAAELAAAGKSVELKLDQSTMPQTTLYTLTSNAMVRAIDADSGETLWSTTAGDPAHPSVGIAASDEYVVSINGSKVYCLEAATGKVLWSQKCRSSVSASPIVEDFDVYVPLFNGRLEKFNIRDKGFNSSALVANGESTTRPCLTPLSVAWGNRKGDLNVAPRWGSRARLAYQLQTGQPIAASPVYKDGMFYVTSLDGFVYALIESRGTLAWEVSTGKAIAQSPITLGNFVFAINDNNELYKFDSQTGFPAPGWELPKTDVGQFIGASQSNLYALNSLGALKVLSQDSGVVSQTVAIGDIDKVLANTKTDRMYVVNRSGIIRCIREANSTQPYFHSGEFQSDGAQPSGAAPGDKPAADPDNPFAQDNPFAKPNADKAQSETDNPFAKPNAGNAPATKPSVDDDPFK